MKFFYTARATFDKSYSGDGLSWADYIAWSRLSQLQELISLDNSLNELLVEPDRQSTSEWEQIITNGVFETGFYVTEEYILSKIPKVEKFNFLMVAEEPDCECQALLFPEYDFVGYELLDGYYGTSALSNCGGFDETFMPQDLNKFGLLDYLDKALDIRKSLYANNPGEDHADCNIIAVWRHKIIGR